MRVAHHQIEMQMFIHVAEERESGGKNEDTCCRRQT
jgi:hypothetical protein